MPGRRSSSARLEILVGVIAALTLASAACAPASTASTARTTVSPALDDTMAAEPAATQITAPLAHATATLRAPTTPSTATRGVRVELAQGGSVARYRAQEQLASRDLPSEAVGETSEVSGAMVLDARGRVVPGDSRLVVALTGLKSDSARRDNYLRRNTLEVERFPNAEFVVREAAGMPFPLPKDGEATFQLIGDLTVHGVTRPATWEVSVRFGPGDVSGLASTRQRISDFGMNPPQVGPVLSIEDEIVLEIEFRADRLDG